MKDKLITSSTPNGFGPSFKHFFKPSELRGYEFDEIIVDKVSHKMNNEWKCFETTVSLIVEKSEEKMTDAEKYAEAMLVVEDLQEQLEYKEAINEGNWKRLCSAYEPIEIDLIKCSIGDIVIYRGLTYVVAKRGKTFLHKHPYTDLLRVNSEGDLQSVTRVRNHVKVDKICTLCW